MKKHIIPILLCLLLTACGSGETSEPDTTADTVPAETEAAETEAEVPFPDSVDYGGRTYTVIACDENVPYTYFELPAEENGDAMNDAIYGRNRQTEEHLNIKLAIETGALQDVTNGIINSVAAGDDAYQLANIHIVEGGANLVTGGNLLNLQNILLFQRQKLCCLQNRNEVFLPFKVFLLITQFFQTLFTCVPFVETIV